MACPLGYAVTLDDTPTKNQAEQSRMPSQATRSVSASNPGIEKKGPESLHKRAAHFLYHLSS